MCEALQQTLRITAEIIANRWYSQTCLKGIGLLVILNVTNDSPMDNVFFSLLFVNSVT